MDDPSAVMILDIVDPTAEDQADRDQRARWKDRCLVLQCLGNSRAALLSEDVDLIFSSECPAEARWLFE